MNPSQSASRSARCVFVGNIPYDATEEQLIEIFQEVGPVVSFRLVFDRDTGKPKGYGFCEFRDQETALSAIRNLNNYEFNGRTLRVDFAETEKQLQAAAAGANAQNARNQNIRTASGTLPNQSTAPSNVETVAAHVESLNAAQMYEMVANMKTVVQQNPDQARQILLANPSFAYALVQAQYLLVPTLIPGQPIMPGPPIVAPGGVPVPGTFQPPVQPFPMKAPVPGYQPPTQPYMQPQPFDAGVLGEQHKELLQQVMSLTPEQIDALPVEQRQQVQQLRQTIMAGGFSQWR